MGGKQVTGPLLLSNEIRKDHGYGDRERERGEEREKKRAVGRALVGVTFPSGLSRGNVIPARGLLQAALDRGSHACPDSQDRTTLVVSWSVSAFLNYYLEVHQMPDLKGLLDARHIQPSGNQM